MSYLLDKLEVLDGTGVHIADKKLFLIKGECTQSLNWEEYGLQINVFDGTISPGETCEVSIAAIVGGNFKFPSGTSLVSAVYAVSVSKDLLRPVQLCIQHCVSLETQEHTNYLSFVTADLYQPELPYQFKLENGGQFYPGNPYGNILTKFSLKAIVKAIWNPIRRFLGFANLNANLESPHNSRSNRIFTSDAIHLYAYIDESPRDPLPDLEVPYSSISIIICLIDII